MPHLEVLRSFSLPLTGCTFSYNKKVPPGERKETHCLIGHVHTVFQTVNDNEPVLGGNRVPGAVCFQPVEAKALYEAVFQSLRPSPSLPFRRQFL